MLRDLKHYCTHVRHVDGEITVGATYKNSLNAHFVVEMALWHNEGLIRKAEYHSISTENYGLPLIRQRWK